MKPVFVLINGRGGTGKTTAMHALLENPPEGWVFFDFDHGKFPVSEGAGKEWRHNQHNWWLEVAAAQHKENNLNVCVFGVGVFPWQIHELPNASLLEADQFVYGMLTCSEATRRKRLAQRGTEPGEGYAEEIILPILEKMRTHGVKEFSSEEASPKDVAGEIREWLESLRP